MEKELNFEFLLYQGIGSSLRSLTRRRRCSASSLRSRRSCLILLYKLAFACRSLPLVLGLPCLRRFLASLRSAVLRLLRSALSSSYIGTLPQSYFALVLHNPLRLPYCRVSAVRIASARADIPGNAKSPNRLIPYPGSPACLQLQTGPHPCSLISPVELLHSETATWGSGLVSLMI